MVINIFIDFNSNSIVQIDNEPNQINVEFLMNKSKNKFFFVSSKEHLKLKRPVTRYDFRGITHNKNNGLPKFKKKGKKIELLQSGKISYLFFRIWWR